SGPTRRAAGALTGRTCRASTIRDHFRPWTTPEVIESWWAHDGFTVEVEKLELERGGELVYTMTASGPEQVEFMRNAGLPLTSTSRMRFSPRSNDRGGSRTCLWSTSCPTRHSTNSSRSSSP